MKRFVCLIALLAVMLPSPVSGQESRKERREARKEARRAEKALMDSLVRAYNEEESVNVGYGTMKKRNLTTSVSQVNVNSDEISTYPDMGSYLAGRVPGLTVRKVGNGYSYTVRGINSINASTEPLFVVDGVTVSDINYLNPKDVKSVEVLKDASASIYGTRGACGVILITTRR